MEKTYTNVYELNLSNPIYRLTLRPTIFLILNASVGVLALIAGFWEFKINWLLIFFGTYFLGMPIYSSLTIKNRIVADLYEDKFLIYDKEENDKAVLITFDEIKSWKYQTGVATGDTMTITLENDQVFLLESFKSNKIIKHFFKRIPEKEERRKVFDILKNK